MKKFAKILAAVLTLAIVSASFVSCALIKDADEVRQIKQDKKLKAELEEKMATTVITVNDDISVSGAYYAYFYATEYLNEYSALMMQQAEAEAAAASDASADSALASDAQSDSAALPEIVVDHEAIKAAAIDQIVAIKTGYAKAVEAGLALTEEDNEYIRNQVNSIRSSYEQSGFTLSMLGTNYSTLEQIVREQMLGTPEAFLANDYVTAKHILITFGEASAEYMAQDAAADSSAEPALRSEEEAKALAEEIKAKLDNGEDFDALMDEKCEDPGIATNPNGYTFGKGEMDPAFEEAAFSLEIGQVSDLVKSSYGYHIIKRCNTSVIAAANAYSSGSYDVDISAKYLTISDEFNALIEAATWAESSAETIEYYKNFMEDLSASLVLNQ